MVESEYRQPEVVQALTSGDITVFQRLAPLVASKIIHDTVAHLQKIIDSENSDLIIVRHTLGNIVGFEIVNLTYKIGYTEGRLDNLIVDVKHRGRGVGRSLIGAAMDWCREKEADSMELNARAAKEEATKLYLSIGMRKRETNVYKIEF